MDSKNNEQSQWEKIKAHADRFFETYFTSTEVVPQINPSSNPSFNPNFNQGSFLEVSEPIKKSTKQEKTIEASNQLDTVPGLSGAIGVSDGYTDVPGLSGTIGSVGLPRAAVVMGLDGYVVRPVVMGLSSKSKPAPGVSARADHNRGRGGFRRV